jgi:hydroxylysine kinase
MDQLIKPGASIKPRTTNEDVTRLLLKLYGIVAREISEINAYDDKNYLISVER